MADATRAHHRGAGTAGPTGLIARFLAEKALRDANLRVFAALDLHGFAGAQYMLDRLDTPLLIEIHLRMLPATHAGAPGIDLAAALRACIEGQSCAGAVDLPAGAGRRLAPSRRNGYAIRKAIGSGACHRMPHGMTRLSSKRC